MGMSGRQPQKRVGIFSGSFDPVHKGHVAFALQALEAANLEVVYFAPEVKPRRKPNITHIAHRTAMLKLAVGGRKNLKVLELPHQYFTTTRTLPRLQQQFPDAQLVLLLGSDLFEHMASWPHVDGLLHKVELVVGARGLYEVSQTLEYVHRLPVRPKGFMVLDSVERAQSSFDIREAVSQKKHPNGIVPSVYQYIQQHWLYANVATARKES